METRNEDVPVIGSGTIGGYTGYLLAKEGFNVTLYEDHEKIGEPCHCTGIITKSFLDMVHLKKGLLLNSLSRVKVFGPDGNATELKTNDIVVDRIGLDEFFNELAVKEGAVLKMGHKMVSCNPLQKTVTIQNQETARMVPYKNLVGADGPNSKLFPLLNPSIQREPWIGAQAVIKGKFDKGMYETYLNNDYCKGFFAWVVPESEESAIAGLAARERPSFQFERFMKKRFGEKFRGRVMSYRGGLIPMHYPKARCEKDGMFLVGDAGGHVKATTGGGIIPGMKAAQALAKSLTTGKSYDKLWRKATGLNLWAHLKIRETLDKFSDNDYNYLIGLMNKERPANVMAHSDREYPGAFALKMLLAEPRMLYFLKHLF